MSEQVRVVAFIEAKPGQEASLEAAARACVAPTRKEADCIEYTLNRDSTNPARFVFVETWASKAALDAHMATPHLKTLLGVVQEAANGDAAIHVLHGIA